MKPQRTPNRWSCLPTAFAIALGVSVREVIERIGHDGSAVAFPGLPEPERRRGFHVQECIDVALALGVSVTPIEAFPRHSSTVDTDPIVIRFPEGNEARFCRTVETTRGVLTGRGLRSRHAVAYDHRLIIDPNGQTRLMDAFHTFSAYCAWRFA